MEPLTNSEASESETDAGLPVHHENATDILGRIRQWIENHGANPAYDLVRSLIQDAGNVLHSCIHEIEICMHDESFFPRLDWLEDLRRDSAYFAAAYTATNGFRIPLGHNAECVQQMDAGNKCLCGYEVFRDELEKWRGQRFANAQPPNTLENRIAVDAARCELDHAALDDDAPVAVDDTPPWDDSDEDTKRNL